MDLGEQLRRIDELLDGNPVVWEREGCSEETVEARRKKGDSNQLLVSPTRAEKGRRGNEFSSDERVLNIQNLGLLGGLLLWRTELGCGGRWIYTRRSRRRRTP